MELSYSQHILNSLLNVNYCLALILNGCLLYCFIKGRLLKKPFDYFSFIIVLDGFIWAIEDIIITAVMFAYNINMSGSPVMCNINGAFSAIVATIYLAANLLYSLDRYYRILKFKDLSVSFMFAVFFGMLGFASLIVILSFIRGSRSMTPMGSQVKTLFC
jgi:hypothetical protein